MGRSKGTRGASGWVGGWAIGECVKFWLAVGGVLIPSPGLMGAWRHPPSISGCHGGGAAAAWSPSTLKHAGILMAWFTQWRKASETESSERRAGRARSWSSLASDHRSCLADWEVDKLSEWNPMCRCNFCGCLKSAVLRNYVKLLRWSTNTRPPSPPLMLQSIRDHD